MGTTTTIETTPENIALACRLLGARRLEDGRYAYRADETGTKTKTDDLKTISYRGRMLIRSTEIGPRGGKRYLYQSIDASRGWGYWYPTAQQAAELSNPSDRIGTGAGI